MPESGASSARQRDPRGETSRLPLALNNIAPHACNGGGYPLRRKRMRTEKFALALATLLTAGIAMADINIGVTLSATGPAASLGIPEKNTLEMIGSAEGGGRSITILCLRAQ